MSFYKNAGGFAEYTDENIEDAYIPLNTVVIYKDLRKGSEVILKCLEKVEYVHPCKYCFFKKITNVYCPVCLPNERKDRKSVTFMIQ